MGSIGVRMKKLEQAANHYHNDYPLFEPESVERIKNLWLESPDCIPYVDEVRMVLNLPDTMDDSEVICTHSEAIVHCSQKNMKRPEHGKHRK